MSGKTRFQKSTVYGNGLGVIDSDGNLINLFDEDGNMTLSGDLVIHEDQVEDGDLTDWSITNYMEVKDSEDNVYRIPLYTED